MTDRVSRSYLCILTSGLAVDVRARITALTRDQAFDRLLELLPEAIDIDTDTDDSTLADRPFSWFDDQEKGPGWHGLPSEYLAVQFDRTAIDLDDVGSSECLQCEATIFEDQDRCPYEDEHPEPA